MTNKTSTRRRLWMLSLVLVLVAAALFGVMVVGQASAQNVSDKAPIYNNSTQNVTGGYWFDDGNVTLNSLGEMAARIGPAIIGTGNEDPSGTGFVGVLALGLVLTGGTLATVMGIGIGPVGGTVVTLVLSYGLIAVGIAPQWGWVLVLFALGGLVAVAALRILHS